MSFSKKYFYRVVWPASLLLLLIIFSTCKKYPEGGFLKRGPKLLVKHSWRLTLYEVNGIDSTNAINYNGDEKYKDMSFLKEGKSKTELLVSCYPDIGYAVNFSQKNTHLEIRMNTSPSALGALGQLCYVNSSHYTGCYRLFLTPEGEKSTLWEIIKLNREELILLYTKTKQYKLKFDPI